MFCVVFLLYYEPLFDTFNICMVTSIMQLFVSVFVCVVADRGWHGIFLPGV